MLKHLFLLMVLILFAKFSFGVTITVSNTSDLGVGSLRQAMLDANSGDVINFSPALQNGTIILASQISITTTIEIDGEDNNITISGNTTTRIFDVDGAYQFTLKNITLTNGYVVGNGGGIRVRNSGSLNLDYVTVLNCQATSSGGGIYIDGESHNLNHINVSGNQAANYGGGLYCDVTTIAIENALISGNVADNGGGAYLHGTINFINSTVTANKSVFGGGAFWVYSGVYVTLSNSIVWNNESAGSTTTSTSFYSNGLLPLLPIIEFSSQGSNIHNSGGSAGWSLLLYGDDLGSNIDQDPLFINPITPASAPHSTGNYELPIVSPSYNTGLNALSVSPKDIRGVNRILFTTVDMGAYEYCKTTGAISVAECVSYTTPSGLYTHTVSGVYMDTIPNTQGCDSILTITLTILNPATGVDTQTACESYTWIDGITYTESNTTATDTIVNGAANGCDSIVTLNLTLNTATAGTDVQSSCSSYTWIDGITYTAHNTTATHTIPNGASTGCDSVVTLNLTINDFVTAVDTQTACGSFTWIDDITYTANTTTPTYTYPNGSSAGCDSIVTLDLTITNSVTGTDVQTACQSYTWIDEVNYTSSNNTATYTFTNGAANGCDSIVTLDLVIGFPTTGVDTQVSCSPLTWIDGNTYEASTNTAEYTLVGGSSAGCDSTVTLNFTLATETFNAFSDVACNEYVSPSGLIWTASGVYNDTIPNALGCDSVLTIDVTLYTSTLQDLTDTACFNYTTPSGVIVYESGTYTDVLQTVNGCDSTLILNVVINTVDTTVMVNEYTITANATDANFVWMNTESHNTPLMGETFNELTVTKPGSYAVEISQNGCVATTETIEIEVLERVVTAFSPNNDGVNDRFTLNIESEVNAVYIYNRWGDVIIEFENYDDDLNAWDGYDKKGNLVMGTCFYVIVAEKGKRSGWVEVVR